MGRTRGRRLPGRRAAVVIASALGAGVVLVATSAAAGPPARPPIYVSFLWHLHQPVYFPDEALTDTARRGAYSFDLAEVHRAREGPYRTWPVDAVQAAMQLPHAGAQVSFSGSLIENLDALEREGWSFGGWKDRWRESSWWRTARGNPRLDLVGFAHHHALLPLLDEEVARRQIGGHRGIHQAAWNGGGAPRRPYSRGFFPPENAFAEHTIPALVAEGLEWVVVDNIHLQRACRGYPWSPGGNLIPPNPAEQQNPDPGDWTQLNGVWAPTRVSAGWSNRPHRARWVDPATGRESRIVVVPTERYLGNEDGRGGFGALQYEQVMSQLEHANTDPAHPILIVLHHDGDNYGGGSDSYYHANWQRFLEWARQNPGRFVPTTIQDYLDEFPPAADDVVHVEPGSWSGADNGDAEFKKWLGDPGRDGYSPDVNSWAVMVAATNRVKTAGSLAPSGPEQALAWRRLSVGLASDHWYWDGTEIWDSNPTRAANEACAAADGVIARGGADGVPPQVFLPQREPYNPGGREWGPRDEPADFTVWTLVHDVSGLAQVTLHWRLDQDGTNALGDDENETFAGGPGVGPWQALAMQPDPLPAPRTNPQPAHRAERFAARLSGLGGRLVDYWVEAVDARGNAARSSIQHVFVGGAPAGVRFEPASPSWTDPIVVRSPAGGVVHWGVNGWQALPPPSTWPAGTARAGGGLETPLLPDGRGGFQATLGPFACALDVREVVLAIRRPDGSWDNAGGRDHRVALSPKQVWWAPLRLDAGPLVVFSRQGGVVHLGEDGWQRLRDVAFQGPDAAGVFSAPIALPAGVTRIDFALRRPDGSWDNAGGRDYRVER